MLHSINYCMCVFLKFIYIYFFLYYRGPCVRKLFTGLIMYYPLKIKNIVLYCIALYCIVLYCIVLYCIVLYFSIFYNWQELMVIPFFRTVYPIFPTQLPVYPQGHLVVALPILILGKLLASTDNVPHCFSGFSTQSIQWCL